MRETDKDYITDTVYRPDLFLGGDSPHRCPSYLRISGWAGTPIAQINLYGMAKVSGQREGIAPLRYVTEKKYSLVFVRAIIAEAGLKEVAPGRYDYDELDDLVEENYPRHPESLTTEINALAIIDRAHLPAPRWERNGVRLYKLRECKITRMKLLDAAKTPDEKRAIADKIKHEYRELINIRAIAAKEETKQRRIRQQAEQEHRKAVIAARRIEIDRRHIVRNPETGLLDAHFTFQFHEYHVVGCCTEQQVFDKMNSIRAEARKLAA